MVLWSEILQCLVGNYQNKEKFKKGKYNFYKMELHTTFFSTQNPPRNTQELWSKKCNRYFGRIYWSPTFNFEILVNPPLLTKIHLATLVNTLRPIIKTDKQHQKSTIFAITNCHYNPPKTCTPPSEQGKTRIIRLLS